MKKSRKFVSMPIVSLEEGIQIGTVRSLVVDPVKMEVAALVIDQRGWFREQKIIPYAKVKSVGSDAVTIDQSTTVQRPISLPEILKLIKERANPIGTKVIAENGTVLGQVDEFYIDETTGKIFSLEISGKFLESLFKGRAVLPIECVRTIGSDVVVVVNEADSKLAKVDGGLQETILNIKESTSSLLDSTLQRTKEISKNIKDKYEKREKDRTDKPETDINIDRPGLTETTGESIEPDPNLDMTSAVEIQNEDVLPEIIESGQPPEDKKTDSEPDAPASEEEKTG